MTPRIHLKSENLQGDQARTLRAAALQALRQASIKEAELTLVYTDDQSVRSLNREHRGEDRVTDVLAFPMGEANPDSGLNYLGDVVISIPQAARQADDAGHALLGELALLTIHGVLHLVGYDHADPEAKATMWAAQDRALRELDLHIAGIDPR